MVSVKGKRSHTQYNWIVMKLNYNISQNDRLINIRWIVYMKRIGVKYDFDCILILIANTYSSGYQIKPEENEHICWVQKTVWQTPIYSSVLKH